MSEVSPTRALNRGWLNASSLYRTLRKEATVESMPAVCGNAPRTWGGYIDIGEEMRNVPLPYTEITDTTIWPKRSNSAVEL